MRRSKEFKKGLKSSEKIAKLLMSTGKLTGWVTKGQVVKAMGGDRQVATDALETMEIYGWCKTRQRNGGIIYGISTKPDVQARNLEELALKFKNRQIIINDSRKNNGNIIKIVNRQRKIKAIKAFFISKWTKILEAWKAFSTGLKGVEK